MLKKIKWYRVLRALLPIVYTILLVKGYMSKSVVYMIVLIGLTILGGAWFCGWLCPVGFAQEWISKLGRLLRIPRITIPKKFNKVLNVLRYVLLGLSFFGFSLIILAQTPYSSFMGIIDLNMSYITKPAWIILISFLVLSITIDRPFCRYFCPEGARYGIFSLLRIFTIVRDDKKCISCKKCDKICPSQIDISTKPDVRSAQCFNCMECIAVCPVKGTLKFGFAFKKKSDK